MCESWCEESSHSSVPEKKDLLDGFLRGEVFGYDGVRPDLPRDSLALGTEGMEIIPHVQLSPGGVADAISVALENVESEFLVLLGDMLLMESHFGPTEAGPENASGASKRLVDAFEKNGLPCVGLFEVEDEEVSKYGIAEISNGMVMGIEEKPEKPEQRATTLFVEDTYSQKIPRDFRKISCFRIRGDAVNSSDELHD